MKLKSSSALSSTILTGSVLFLLSAIIVFAQTEDEGKTFSTSKFLFSIKYPSDWTVLLEEEEFSPGIYDGSMVTPPGSASIVDFCPTSEVGANPQVLDCQNKSPVYVGISAYKLKEGTTLKEFSDQKMSLVNSLKSMPRTNVETNKIEISGLDGYQVIDKVSFPLLEKESKVMNIFTVNGDIGYQIFFDTENSKIFGRFLPIFQKMIDSFEVVKSENSSRAFQP
jgi:hypothetical protein